MIYLLSALCTTQPCCFISFNNHHLFLLLLLLCPCLLHFRHTLYLSLHSLKRILRTLINTNYLHSTIFLYIFIILCQKKINCGGEVEGLFQAVMAVGWVRSLHCKSKALDDVVHHRRRNVKIHHSLTSSNSSSCRSSVQNLKDIVQTATRSKPEHPPPPKRPHPRKSEAARNPQPTIITRFTGADGSLFPSLSELPEGHPSRNVVEIIFRSGWGEKDFSGRVELVFKVQNLTRTITRFEEYREIVKGRARSGGDGADHERCIADGNEVLRFYCLGATSSGGACCESSGGAWGFQSGKGAGAAVCTYSGSGVAHEKAGGGRGRRAMLVCRVIAGRAGVGYDSVSRETGEVYVFDTRAVLPCFLIIYNKL